MTNTFFRLLLAVVVGVMGLALVSPASAGPMGSLDLANCAGGGVTFTATTVTWLPTGGCTDTGAGTNLVISGGTLGPGTTGSLLNLTFGGGAVDHFMSFSSAPSLDFTLTSIGPGTSSTVCSGLLIGQSCSPLAGSPYVLTSLGLFNTVFSFQVGGTVSDPSGTGSWFGVFSSQFNQSALTIQTTLLAGGSITNTYSGQFTVTSLTSSVPEPSSMALLGCAALFLGCRIFRWSSFRVR